MVARTAGFVKQVVSSTLYRPDGTVETTRDAAVWTLAHRGYSGSGRLDVWAYRTKDTALRAGARLAMDCGMDEDARCRELFDAGRWAAVMERYEELSRDGHLLRVQAAFLQLDDE
ncbi:hypothetical protein W59_25626 [Rhodococcus opacus RKJ300 = JCM 13270]|uniref:Uncharacterized protein n=1 Tax=Rhodococcus opacus RKJ300 = JCM 13270 TaxID=1165867 RepID=I0WKQ2_RHOOP|nr:hypothetical protein W59_25626 [Rhodococcus opacus RKJ300 = JCM 13270]QQZ18854.1 hypothetical protein GO592_35620 [Rhodococcus sp. 21391]